MRPPKRTCCRGLSSDPVLDMMDPPWTSERNVDAKDGATIGSSKGLVARSNHEYSIFSCFWHFIPPSEEFNTRDRLTIIEWGPSV